VRATTSRSAARKGLLPALALFDACGWIGKMAFLRICDWRHGLRAEAA